MIQRSDHVIVVGAGIAGLSAAALLAHAGRRVTVCEAQPVVGGKARRLPSPAGPVDAGPTVFTMRNVFDELFEETGARLEDHVRLARLDILARHVWPDGSSLDLMADMDDSAARIAAFAGRRSAREFRDFTARARTLFEAFEKPVMRHARPSPAGVATALGLSALRVQKALGVRPDLAGTLERQFSDPRLVQLFARYSTYVGGSPWLSPAVLMLIWRAEAAGVWAVEGGIAALARALGDLAVLHGAEIRTEAPVARILVEEGRTAGVVLAEGETLHADQVIFNGDPAALGAGLLGPGAEIAAPAMKPSERSLSACVWTFAGRPQGVDLAHHTVFFSDDYRSEFEDLFAKRQIPRDPTLYISAQDRKPGRDRRDPERLMMIMNAPADGDGPRPDPKEIETWTHRAFARLEASGLKLETPPAEALTTPWEFARLFPGTGGAIYGGAPHGMMATFRRPMTQTQVPGLYLAGGGAHPGPGVAMACLSGRLAAAAIISGRVSI